MVLPGGLQIGLPFDAGESVRVHAGYGPDAGSSLHCRAQDSQCANDWYALDLTLDGWPDSGKGRPVLAIAAGTVLAAGWGSEGWSNYGRRVYLRHEMGGHHYTSMYAHLDSILVSEGDSVDAGAVLGTLGQSCQGADSCASFSTPHLHFSIHRDAGFGGSGSGGSYGGRAVIPEPFDGYSDLNQGAVLVAAGDPAPDPDPACPIVVSGDVTFIEEDGPCATETGGAKTDIDGHGGHAWQITADVPAPDYGEGVIWRLEVAEAGPRDVWLHIPEVANPTAGALYKLKADGASTKYTRDQSETGWVLLDTVHFAQGSDQWLRLGDTVIDAADEGRAIVLDAVRVTTPGYCTCPACVDCDRAPPDDGPDPDPGSDSDASGRSDASGGSDTPDASDSGSSAPEAADGSSPPLPVGGLPRSEAPSSSGDSDGGGCTAGGHSRAAWPPLVLFLMLLFSWRRWLPAGSGGTVSMALDRAPVDAAPTTSSPASASTDGPSR